MHAATRVGLAGLVASLVLSAAAATASVESEIAFHRGVVAYGEGRYEEARASFLKVLEADAEDASAIHYLGLIASEQGDFDEAIGHYQQALALEPDNTDVRLDLGVAQLEGGRLVDARQTLAEVLAAEPDRARAQLFAGIVEYRLGNYEEAKPYLDRAAELDPETRDHAMYYTGLAQAFLGDIPAATGTFSDVEQSPMEPLANSAAGIREALEPPPAEEARRWALSFTAGGEYDDNPTVVGSGAPATLQNPGIGKIDRDPDGRAVMRFRGSYRFLQEERYNASVGYDGYLSTHGDASVVDLQTHVAYFTGGLNFDPVRFNVRYDFAYTFIDLTEELRYLNRVTPSLTFRQSTWGVSQLYYQFQYREYELDVPDVFDRTGPRHTPGFNQFLFPGDVLPEWMRVLNYVRVGALGAFQDTDGREFTYDAWEVAGGAGFSLPWDTTLTLLYRYTRRYYENNSIFVPFKARDDKIQRFTVELVKPISQHFEWSVGGAFRWQDSNIGFYDYDRNVAGTYVTYRF